MASRVAAARNALHGALSPVLPGRVDPYPPPAGRVAAPKVWIGDVDTTPTTIGTSTTVTLARFPVVIVYDGAVHAQVAGIDDLLSAVLDAVNSEPGFEADGSRPGLPLDMPLDSTLRGHIVTASVTITARTLCPPAPTFDVVEGDNDVVFNPVDPIPIPSTPMEAAHG
jgi:hypothetical protein